MPWTGKSFKARHNKSLTSSQASKAAKIANAMLARGESEAMAIMTANARAKRKGKKK